MPVFGMRDQNEHDVQKRRQIGVGSPFEVPQEMAMRLMVQPAAGVIAMSAIGFGMATQAFGLWLGAVTGTAQAMQRLFVPTDSEPALAAAPKRQKPALKVVAQNEPDESARVMVEAKPVEPLAPAKAAAPLQPEGLRKPRTIERPTVPDDLKAISGIGPKLEKVLNDLGVWTYEQVAGWEKEEVAWIDDYLAFRGRIDRDGWIEQARALSSHTGEGRR